MFMFVVTYSYDASKPTFGPFSSDVEAWETMCEQAENETAAYVQDHDGAKPELSYDEDAGEITMTTPNLVAGVGDDTQKWTLLEYPQSTGHKDGLFHFSATFVADKASRDKLKQLEHHAEYLLDLESWPEIKQIFGVQVEEVL